MKKELVAISLLIMLLTGCQNNGTPPSNQIENDMNNQEQSVENGVNHADEHMNHTQNTDHSNSVEAQQTKAKSQAVADNNEEAILRLENLAKGIDGVKNAHVVIIGNTAIVGIDVDPDLERSRVGTIKYSVAEAVRHDPYGKQAIVTADIDMRQRLTEIRQDIAAGKPIQGFVEELADIVGRLIPQIPSDLIPAQKEYETQMKTKTNTNSKSNLNNNNYTSPDHLIKDYELKHK